MGKQKGKHSFSGGGMGSIIPKAKEVKAPREKSVKKGEKVAAPEGLPAGWIAEKFAPLTGKPYLRFSSADGKHKDVSTVTAAIRKDAADKGYAAEPAIQQHQKRQEEAQRQKAPREDDEQQKAIDAFRAKHGFLAHATVAHLDGWEMETRVIEKTGQKKWAFKGPDGTVCTMLKEVEAALGKQVLAGKEVEGLAEARKGQATLPKMKVKLRRKHPAKKGKGAPSVAKKMSVDKKMGKKRKVNKTIKKTVKPSRWQKVKPATPKK